MNETISICMIVKNEQACLPRAIKDWRDLADELVVVDTGSTDATVEIAQANGARVLHYDWQFPGHKGEARNVGIDAATGDYVVVLDADEVIESPAVLRELILAHPDITAWHVMFRNYDAQGNATLEWYQPRVFRRAQYRYVHREHELPFWHGDGERNEAFVNHLFRHLPPPERAQPKISPMLERLRLDVEERPDDPHSAYFLHRQYLIGEQYAECLESGLAYLRLCDRLGIDAYADVHLNISICEEQLGNVAAAIQRMYLAISGSPRRRDFWRRLASLYQRHHKAHDLAIAVLQAGLAIWPEPTGQTEPSSQIVMLAMLEDSQRALAQGGKT